ncbi:MULTISPECIES: ROK family transcriptional regulator [Streptomycetaceae]|uniref:Xylose repressor n=1 Tax=Streptantibioticus cattleyicolor (strain ATCC 35852 / DSM 46488 / JCM 4925 / NBRC 14057 / NRRL 8057) TaxID=1003195 RepID=F8K2Y6_STREN|nr:ROK family transcriptional regulator [Streptantibioticus cattleyicolor]AEW92474.1 xylose repressor [Streptantibioticus cattleyicolor NRRL 8057 = DSM 46488]MYS57278.1 ROK family protein [Streptomyces sp. SID5468]CCB72835.1 putative xylose operon regulator [Streptantibioticus cattleyicolor NRRL 8057 = DSM 46488]
MLDTTGRGVAQSPSAASQRDMRRHNLAAVLRTVAAHGPLSRAAVADHTGLTRAAVSSLVDQLRADGLVAEVGRAPSGRVGRPGTALAVNERGPAGLGLEIGVSHLGACVVDLRGEVRVWLHRDTGNRGRDAAEVLAELSALAGRAIDRAGAEGLRPVAAVLSVPGVVGADPGVLEHAPNLGWRQVAVAGAVPSRGVPLRAENEANLGALAEVWTGSPGPDVLHVSAEAGIGAALVIGGRLFRGARGFAGELGHVPVHPSGPPCGCGARGCLERYAGLEAVRTRAGLAPDAADGDVVAALAARAREGDARTRGALGRAATALGTALTGAVNLMDPATVVLGGAYAELAPWLLPGMRRELAARVTVRPWRDGQLTVSVLGRRGPLLGAALSTVRRIVEDPVAAAPEGGWAGLRG